MKIALIVLLGFASVSYAGQDGSKQVRQVGRDLKQLQQAGVALHQKYDLDTDTGRRACFQGNQDLVKKVRSVKQAIKDVEPEYRLDLTTAADAAAGCVSCREDGSSCGEVGAGIRKAEQLLKRYQAPAASVSVKDKW